MSLSQNKGTEKHSILRCSGKKPQLQRKKTEEYTTVGPHVSKEKLGLILLMAFCTLQLLGFLPQVPFQRPSKKNLPGPVELKTS